MDNLPAANYPPGWNADIISEPTFQSKVPGCLIPPAVVFGQLVTEANVVRDYASYYTSIQTGARQLPQV